MQFCDEKCVAACRCHHHQPNCSPLNLVFYVCYIYDCVLSTPRSVFVSLAGVLFVQESKGTLSAVCFKLRKREKAASLLYICMV